MQTLSALCNAAVVGLQTPTFDDLNSTPRDELLEVNQRMNIWKVLLRVPPVLGFVVFVAGCVIVPLPSETIESNITDDNLSFLVKAQTLKSEVRKNLGEPEAAFQGDSNWIYAMRIYLTRLGGCYGGWEAGCEAWSSKLKMKVLKIDFDDRGVVSDWSKSSAVVSECTTVQHICGTEERYVVYAWSDVDAEAKVCWC